MPVLARPRARRRARRLWRRATPPAGRVRPDAAGLALGAFVATLHVVWAVLVATRAAQPMTDFLFRLHMIEPVWRVGPFRPRVAAALVLITGTVGFLYGVLGGALWNALAAGRARARA